MKNISARFLLAALLATAAVGAGSSPNILTAAEKADGWRLLYDGRTLAGWRGYMGSDIARSWSSVDGELTLRGGNARGSHINIITEGQFKDFDLRFEWKIGAGANSGLMFHVQEGPRMPYLTGPEYQILDNEGFRDSKGKPVARREYTASHYAIEEALVDVVKPIGEWNASRILVVGNAVKFYLNGSLTAEYVMHSPKWKEQVANSKFANWKPFGTTTEGHFALQDHGHGVAFRNIKVKEL